MDSDAMDGWSLLFAARPSHLAHLAAALGSMICLGACGVQSAGELGTYESTPLENVSVTVTATEFKRSTDLDGTELVFLYYHYTVTNASESPVTLSPGAIQLRANRIVSNETHYHSLASAEAELDRLTLDQGVHKFSLYSVFPVQAYSEPLDDFEVLESGLSADVRDRPSSTESRGGSIAHPVSQLVAMRST